MTLKPIVLLALALVCVGAGCASGWEVQDWRHARDVASLQRDMATMERDYADARRRAATAVSVALQNEQERAAALRQSLSDQSTRHFKEMENAQKEIAVLRSRVATGDVRLSVVLDAASTSGSGTGCGAPAPVAGGVVHAAARAELDPAHAERIIAITDDGDQAIRALAACQGYARQVSVTSR